VILLRRPDESASSAHFRRLKYAIVALIVATLGAAVTFLGQHLNLPAISVLGMAIAAAGILAGNVIIFVGVALTLFRK